MGKPSVTVNRLWWLWLFGAIAIYGVLAWMVPMEYDSLRFDAIYRRYNGGSEGFSWSAWYHYACELAEIDNARLSNIVAPVMSLTVPRWLWGLLTGVAMAVMIGFATVLTGARRLPALAMTWVMLIVLMPWSNCVWVGDYALNYIYTGALTMVLAWLVIGRADAVPSRRAVAPRIAAAFILAVIVGWMHEQFALGLACGLIAWVIIGQRESPASDGRTRPVPLGLAYVLTISVTLIAVSIVALSCPGMIVRFYHSGVEARMSSVQLVLIKNSATLLLWAILILGLVVGGRRWWRWCCSRPVVVIMSAGALAAMVIHLVMGAAPRSAFAATLMAIVALVALAKPVLDRKKWTILSILIILLCYAQGIMACVAQYPYYKQYHEIMAEIKAHPGQTIYRDVLPVYHVEKWKRGMSSRATWIEPFTYLCLWEETSLEGSVVVPTRLDRDLDANPLPEMVSDTVPAPDTPTPFYYCDENGRQMCYLPFHDRKGRLRYYYYYPDEY